MTAVDAGRWIAGVDGFKSRWFVVLRHTETGELRCRIVSNFAALLHLEEAPVVVAVDIPVGLPEVTMAGGRACDVQARRVLGKRRSSVFNPVGRKVLSAASRAEGDAASRADGGLGIGAQTWGLVGKLREVEAAMTPEAQRTIFEAHPEVSFWAMNDRSAMASPKKSSEGLRCRQAVLVEAGLPRAFINCLAADLRVERMIFSTPARCCGRPNGSLAERPVAFPHRKTSMRAGSTRQSGFDEPKFTASRQKVGSRKNRQQWWER